MQVSGLFKLTNKYSKCYITVNTNMRFCWANPLTVLLFGVYHCYPQNKVKKRYYTSKRYNLSLPFVLPSKAVINANWVDFLIGSQGSILTLVLLRKQIMPMKRESGPSPSVLKGRQL